MRAAAFFDVDGTLISRPSSLVLVPALRREGIVTRRGLARAAWWELGARVRGSTEPELHRVTAQAARALTGFSAERMAAVAAAELDGRLLPLVHPGALELLRRHHDAGEPAIAVTGALREIVDPLATRLGLERTIATEVAVDADGRYTGKLVRSCHGAVKVAAVRELAAAEGLDLTASAAYSDSASDLPLLELVGHPSVVNPDRRLRRVAEERGWPVVRV